MSRVVVVGGGFAGLAAAVQLAARGLRPLVLEARPQLGGRACSFIDVDSGERVDNGQHAMMGCYLHTFAFLERIGATAKLVRQANLRVVMAHRERGTGVIAGLRLPSPLHMAGGVLAYRLLSVRERGAALRAGLTILRWYRRGDARLAERTVAELLGGLRQSANAQAAFWNPVAVATLNELPERAAALPFAAVLARAFFGSRRDAQFVLPGVDLSGLYTDDARRFIEARGGQVETHAAVAELELRDGRVSALRLRDGRRLAAAACIAALPPRALAALLPAALRATPTLRALDEFGASPIVSVHLWLDRAVLREPFLGCIGTTTHWFFNRSALHGAAGDGQRLSAVISAAHAIVGWPSAQIASAVVDDLRALVPAARAAAVRRHVVVKEKHATISTTPQIDGRRPPAATAAPNLWLAGDWTATGLPPTIESAVLSGHRAADLLIAQQAA